MYNFTTTTYTFVSNFAIALQSREYSSLEYIKMNHRARESAEEQARGLGRPAAGPQEKNGYSAGRAEIAQFAFFAIKIQEH